MRRLSRVGRVSFAVSFGRSVCGQPGAASAACIQLDIDTNHGLGAKAKATETLHAQVGGGGGNGESVESVGRSVGCRIECTQREEEDSLECLESRDSAEESR